MLPHLQSMRPLSAQESEHKLHRDKMSPQMISSSSKLQSTSSRIASKSFWNISMLWEREHSSNVTSHSTSDEDDDEDETIFPLANGDLPRKPSNETVHRKLSLDSNADISKGNTNEAKRHYKKLSLPSVDITQPLIITDSRKQRSNSLESPLLNELPMKERVSNLESRPIIISSMPSSNDPFHIRTTGPSSLPKELLLPLHWHESNDSHRLTQQQQLQRKRIQTKRAKKATSTS